MARRSAIPGTGLLSSLSISARALHTSLFGNIEQPCSVAASMTALRAVATDAAAQQQQQQQQELPQQPYKTPIYAACVVERLPIVKSPPPAWEAAYKAWAQLTLEQERLLKRYPQLDGKQQQQQQQRDAQGGSKGAPTFNAVTTAADASGRVDTMKRRLADKLVLLVRARHDALAAPAGSGDGSNRGSSGGGGGGGSAAAAAAAAGGPGWTFPHARYQAGETIRQTAERALREAVGLSQVYFVGNAPMAHLNVIMDGSSSSSSSGSVDSGDSGSSGARGNSGGGGGAVVAGRVFFHLAQVVNDPWEVALAPGGGATEHAWVTRDELAAYIRDARLLALAQKML